MSASQIRLALVGRSGETNVYADISKRLRGGYVTTVVDQDPQRGRSLADAVGGSFVVRSFEVALHEHGMEFEAVVIRLPFTQREDVIRQAAEAGKHILVEAPFATTVAATEEIMQQCSEAKVCLAICGTLRFHPSHRTIMSRLADGKLGIPGLLPVHRWRPSDAAAPAALVENVFADVDLALCLFGESPDSVYAIRRATAEQSVGTAEMPEYLQIHFGFPAGGMAILDFANTFPSGQSYDSLSLIGSSGAAYADDHHNTHLLYGDDRRGPRVCPNRQAGRCSMSGLPAIGNADMGQRSQQIDFNIAVLDTLRRRLSQGARDRPRRHALACSSWQFSRENTSPTRQF
jgi:predicted dehydrogenase